MPFDELDNNRDIFRQAFVEQTMDQIQKHPLIEEIHRWEREAIKKIQQTADETKQIEKRNARIEFKINTLTDQLKKVRLKLVRVLVGDRMVL